MAAVARKNVVEYNEANAATLEHYFSFQLKRINYLMNISMAARAIYMEVPKSACSTIKRNMQQIESAALGLPVYEDVHKKHRSPLVSPLKTPDDLKAMLEDFFKFSYVRNPFSRALSCYLDKIIGSEYEQNLRRPQLGFTLEEDVSFEQFLEAVSRQKPEEMDIHWKPQYVITGEGRIQFDFIGRFEELSSSLPKLLRYLSGRAGVTYKDKVQNVVDHKTGANSKLSEFYTSKEISLVRTIYDRDFQTFGYSKILEFV